MPSGARVSRRAWSFGCIVKAFLFFIMQPPSENKSHEHEPVTTRYEDDVVLLPPRATSGSPSPTVVPGVASGVHDVLLLLLLLPLFIHCPGATAMYVLLLFCSLLLVLLLCLRYVFASDSRPWLLCKSTSLGDIPPHLKAERQTHLLWKLYLFLTLDIYLASRRRCRASVIFV